MEYETGGKIGGQKRTHTDEVQMTNPTSPSVFNALLRCNRLDERADPLFQRVDRVPGLWVLELGPDSDCSWSGWLATTQELLSHHKTLLETLSVGSSDYTLHIVLDDPLDHQSVVFPPAFTALVSSFGINIELYVYRL